jgi:type IV pilus assembly protein PilW
MCKVNNKGITLIELLVVIFIFVLVIFTSYSLYLSLLKGSKQDIEISSFQMESLIGLEILRLDLEHIGYGIPSNETALVITWSETDKKL